MMNKIERKEVGEMNEKKNDELEGIFANAKLLRMEMQHETERFKEERKEEFPTQGEMNKALREHLNKKYQQETDKIISLQRDLLGL